MCNSYLDWSKIFCYKLVKYSKFLFVSHTDVDQFVESSAGDGQNMRKLYMTLSRSYTNIHTEHPPNNGPPADQQFLKSRMLLQERTCTVLFMPYYQCVL